MFILALINVRLCPDLNVLPSDFQMTFMERMCVCWKIIAEKRFFSSIRSWKKTNYNKERKNAWLCRHDVFHCKKPTGMRFTLLRILHLSLYIVQAHRKISSGLSVSKDKPRFPSLLLEGICEICWLQTKDIGVLQICLKK